ncbi:hypothetical protein JMM63_19265 [Rhodovulum sulfidophilum]|uniref:DUF304 domain-containing protein n=1 Tax=Rhodovulum sulfidophilum TaxID=35806 RepID=A0ABS1RNF1_RHOSU|nr:hypothetical protein [Rhodovulum sulfidophilum]ANB34140.1 hypothetical protein A6W98_08700 [Rhodovulum sulfidophilum DSM 1374]ANB37963.1 hypothetical protein A6024_08560 [Rhodovulum sulfidophilum]MBL3554247.1 hypothetical protein [Rhodovulum sulfidophilum]MBL3560709.1 hypothetical protein [Rhodovulum sulfidophilum]MBL3597666.1 hypothetical protein [Rhodovulum sulfidophilum]
MFDPKTEAPLEDGETVQIQFRADRGAYLKAHAIIAVLAGIGATVLLAATGNPYPWAGIVAAVLAIAVRGAFLMSDELGTRWVLTDRALLGPGGRRVRLSSIARVRTIGAATQVITLGGDKHLIKFLADPAGVKTRIEAARMAAGGPEA